jgi:hypothetical protein
MGRRCRRGSEEEMGFRRWVATTSSADELTMAAMERIRYSLAVGSFGVL